MHWRGTRFQGLAEVTRNRVPWIASAWDSDEIVKAGF